MPTKHAGLPDIGPFRALLARYNVASALFLAMFISDCYRHRGEVIRATPRRNRRNGVRYAEVFFADGSVACFCTGWDGMSWYRNDHVADPRRHQRHRRP